ncbi:MAG: hypothetical protein CMP10_18385 [Zetaproteobacteria bacterium]|nr:hypothetical protein [Pseudobdellovibrionaceae bacterium]
MVAGRTGSTLIDNLAAVGGITYIPLGSLDLEYIGWRSNPNLRCTTLKETREIRSWLSPAKSDSNYVNITSSIKGMESLGSEVSNISSGGIFLKTDRLLNPGDDVEVQIEALRKGKEIKSKGIVRWCRAQPDGPLSPVGMGIQFNEPGIDFIHQWQKVLSDHLDRPYAIDYINTKYKKVFPDQSALSVAKEMVAEGKSLAVIVDKESKPLGVFNADVFLKHWLVESKEAECPVETCLTEASICGLDMLVEDAFRKLAETNQSVLLLCADEMCVGILESRDFVRFWDHLKYTNRRQAGDRFVRVMNRVVHDLRNPIGVIKTASDLLTRGYMTPEVFMKKGMPGMIQKNCNTMLKLTDDLVFSREEDFTSYIREMIPIDLGGVVTEQCQNYRLQAENKPVKIKLKIKTSPIIVEGDPGRLGQVLANLISNGIKYSWPDHTLLIKLEKAGDQALLQVQDTGAGIPSDEIDVIFDEFCKVSTKPTAGESSIGLGLSITKQLVEAHGGTITANSTVDKGTTFEVRLPLART